jgi:hypothetical protein
MDAFRGAVLWLFVRLALFAKDYAAGMLTWPPCGFLAHLAVRKGPHRVPENECALATRLVWYGARNPVTLERLTDDRGATAATYRFDKAEGPTAGTETADTLSMILPVPRPAPPVRHTPGHEAPQRFGPRPSADARAPVLARQGTAAHPRLTPIACPFRSGMAPAPANPNLQQSCPPSSAS